MLLDTDFGTLRKQGDLGVILTAAPLDTCGVAYTNTLTSGQTFGLVSKDCATGLYLQFLQTALRLDSNIESKSLNNTYLNIIKTLNKLLKKLTSSNSEIW